MTYYFNWGGGNLYPTIWLRDARTRFRFMGLTENAGRENDGPSKLQGMKLQDMKMTDQFAGHEIAGHENAGHENAGHENDGPKMTPGPGREMEC